jgi:hypothetical protein
MSSNRNPKRAPHIGWEVPDDQNYVTAPDLSVTITREEAVTALVSLHEVHGGEWLELTNLQRILTTAAALSVAMGHDADWTLRQLANPYFFLAAKVLSREFTRVYEAGLLP